MDGESLRVATIAKEDRSWVTRVLIDAWGSTEQVTRGRVHQADRLPGFIAWRGDDPVGVVTYHIVAPDCEIVTLNSTIEGEGIGTALVAAVAAMAQGAGCRKIWLLTTNDNLRALRFYQRRGFHLVAVFPGAMTRERLLKPEIPPIGHFGIEIRDEIELEMPLDDESEIFHRQS
jgi:ribosomal protein S18 acetylase RimI-like enzyme